MANHLDITIRKDRLYEQVADQIEERIISEALRPGDRLPSERSLAESLGVSRPVIREAITVLISRGLVEVRPGSGSYIKEMSSESASKPIERYLRVKDKLGSFSDLHDIRRALEVDIAGLAAERATDEDIQKLEAAFADQQKWAHDPQRFTKADFDFHTALAAATQNELYGILLAPITDLMLEFRLVAYDTDPQASIEGALIHHHHLIETIKNRDPEKARAAMLAHLKQAETLYFETVEQNQVE
jgi:GntR family transcriptional repressor for pyruvate dehydrogenase complex